MLLTSSSQQHPFGILTKDSAIKLHKQEKKLCTVQRHQPCSNTCSSSVDEARLLLQHQSGTWQDAAVCHVSYTCHRTLLTCGYLLRKLKVSLDNLGRSWLCPTRADDPAAHTRCMLQQHSCSLLLNKQVRWALHFSNPQENLSSLCKGPVSTNLN